ncbi:Zinc finger C2H2-type, partial [Trinorchestia longiramus]
SCVAGGRCVCPYCSKVISNKHNLKTHITDKHTPQTERFLCKLCGRHYSTKHSLATHTSTVHRGRSSPRGAAARAARMAATFVVPPHPLAFGQSELGSALGSRSLLGPPPTPLLDIIGSGHASLSSSDSKDSVPLPSLSFSSPSVISSSTVPSCFPPRTSSSESDLITLGSLLPATDALEIATSSVPPTSTPNSLADVVANLPPCDVLDATNHDQIQAMAHSLAQVFPSNHMFPSLSDFDE